MKRSIRLAIMASLLAVVTAPATSAGGRHDLTTSPLDGRWRTTRATLHQLLVVGLPRKAAEALAQHGPKTPGLDFRNSAFKGLDLDTGKVVATGTYRLGGNLIRLVFRRGIAVRLGTVYELKWSVYGDRLTFSSVSDRPTLWALTITPWTRVT